MEYNHWLPKLMSKLIPGRVNGTVLFGTAYFYYPKEEVSGRLYRHEKAHLRQQERDGMLYFKLRYITEFLLNLLKYRSFFTAYYNISYEVEARAAE